MNWMRNLVLLINNYWKQQTDNNKTLISFFYWLKTVIPCSKFCINITHLNESEALMTVMSGSFFFSWPRNYYNCNNFGVQGRARKIHEKILVISLASRTRTLIIAMEELGRGGVWDKFWWIIGGWAQSSISIFSFFLILFFFVCKKWTSFP